MKVIRQVKEEILCFHAMGQPLANALSAVIFAMHNNIPEDKMPEGLVDLKHKAIESFEIQEVTDDEIPND